MSSPAWNAAAGGLALDQRGQPRPAMGGYDIGAFELCLDHTGNPCTIIVGYQTVTLDVGPSSIAAGNIVPSGRYEAPVNSVIILAARPNPSFCFVNWTGNVSDASSPTTTIIMEHAQSAIANFAPIVTSAAAIPVLNPMANHGLVNVGLMAADNCGATPAFQVAVFGDEDDQAATDKKGTVFSPDATNIGVGTLQLRAERADSSDGRVYLIVVRDTDAKGNIGFSCSSVVVPHDSSASALAKVNSQAAAARAYCQGNNGAPPPRYFVIGDGPVTGPKQ